MKSLCIFLQLRSNKSHKLLLGYQERSRGEENRIAEVYGRFLEGPFIILTWEGP
jgi:hypothetical protein